MISSSLNTKNENDLDFDQAANIKENKMKLLQVIQQLKEQYVIVNAFLVNQMKNLYSVIQLNLSTIPNAFTVKLIRIMKLNITNYSIYI